MSDLKRDDHQDVTRRDFLCGAAGALAGLSALGATAVGAQQPKSTKTKALDDPNITHGEVTFRSGANIINGYLARPKKKGQYRAVVVIPGNWISEPYIPETVAMLAQGGFIGLVVNIFHLFPKTASYEEARKIPWEETQRILRTQITDQLIFQDIQSGINYLKSQPFTKSGRVGIMRFCFGGRNALLFATQSKDIAAVVPFYAPVTPIPGVTREERPKQPLDEDVVKQIKVPVQGHYGTKDRGVPLADVEKFAAALRAQGTPVEIFTYEAGHGFFAYNREGAFQPEAAQLAWSRTLEFFQRHLK